MGEQWPGGVVAVGKQVYLRLPRESDRAGFRRLIEASQGFLRPWEPAHLSEVTPDARFDRLCRVNAEEASRKHLICRLDDEAIVGCMNINNPIHGVFQCAMLGYWMGAPYVRRGYMGEALQLALARCFLGQALHRVEANIKPDNAASIALVERAGFRREGLSIRYLQIAGVWADHARYALLADEWTAPAWVRHVLRDEG